MSKRRKASISLVALVAFLILLVSVSFLPKPFFEVPPVFATSETRYFRSDAWSTVSYPTSQTVVKGYASGTFPDDILTSNNVYCSYFPGGTPTAIQVDFVGQQTGKVAQMLCHFEMKSAFAGFTGYIALWDYVNGRYATVGEDGYLAVTTTASDLSYDLYVSSNCQRYRDASGNWKVELYLTNPSSTYLYIDHIYVEYKGFKLETSNTNLLANSESIGAYSKLGVRVWKHSADGTETEITSGTQVALVDIADAEVDGTWTCPQTTLALTDAVIVRFYKYDGTWHMLLLDVAITTRQVVFMTSDIGDTPLNNVLWTLHYCIDYNDALDDIVLYWGKSTEPTRITNFDYGTPAGYALNLRVMDWDLTDSISGATVYKDTDTLTSNGNGWANWTLVTGTVVVKVKYFGFWVNGTFSVTMSSDQTINIKCKLYDVAVTEKESVQTALLSGANITVFNATSTYANRIKSGVTGSNGQVAFTNLPNNTLTFTQYAGSSFSIVIGNATQAVTTENQAFTLTANQNYADTTSPYGIIVIVTGFVLPLKELPTSSNSRKKRRNGAEQGVIYENEES